MTRDEFFSALKRRPVGVVCGSCRNVVSIDTTEKLGEFISSGIFECHFCGKSIEYKGYSFQGEFIFSYINIESPEPRYQAGENSAETLFVDFENSKLYDASKEADFFHICFKYKSDIQITFLLE